ncbi:lipoprotein LpqV [Mycobacterium simiae]|uniref:lipoprotein LpqV n=1 Tax=Mycobacterium simiae TaxID=1784 RepID=UPI00261E1DB3|nr:lipoprotein LpqV [Mycobacterium simiae]
MRWRSDRPLRWGALIVAVGCAVSPGVAGCSSGGAPGGKTTSSPTRTPPGPTGPAPAPAGAVGLSPAGVTTRVDVPAESTEEEYYQACHAAKVWMDAHHRPGESLFEPYLAMLQTTSTSTAGTWNMRWSDLTPARQAAVITAVRAAADNECD